MTYKVVVNKYGAKRYYFNGILHREGGPAVETSSGYKEWRLNGALHREGGPAIERPNGTKEWYLSGKPHREDGPAIEFADGKRYWYLCGILLTKEDWLEQLSEELKEVALFDCNFILR